MTAPGYRVASLDIAKGAGMVLVVVAHVLLGSEADFAPPVVNAIYAFHMPLFFVLSGFTLKQQQPLAFALRKIFVLGLPYLAFLAALGVPALLLSCGFGVPYLALGIDRCPVFAVKLVFGGSLLGGIFGTFWFVPCLLGGLVLAQLVLYAREGYGRVLMFALLLSAAYTLPILAPWSTKILSLGSMPMAAVLVLIGHRLARSSWVSSNTALVGCVAVGLLVLVSNTALDFKYADYGLPVISVVGAIALSCLVIAASKQIASASVLAGALGSIGQRTLTVMYLHQLVHLGLRLAGLHNDAVLALLSLAVPLVLHTLVNRGFAHLAHSRWFDLSRKSPLLQRPLK